MMKKNNLIYLILIGTIPFLGGTSRIAQAFWLSVVYTVVLMLSVLISYPLKRYLHGLIRSLADVTVISALSTVGTLIVMALIPDAPETIAVFIPMLCGNAVVLSLCESNAEDGFKAIVKNTSVASGIGMAVLLFTAVLRELLAYGTVFSSNDGIGGIRIFSDWFTPVDFAGHSAGALILFGLLAAWIQKLGKAVRLRKREKENRHETILAGTHPDLVFDPETGKLIRRTTAELLEQKRHEFDANAENVELGEEIAANAEENENAADAEKQSDHLLSSDESNSENGEVHES